MASSSLSISGDAKARISNAIKNLTKSKELTVGFLEGATYPDGQTVAMVAAVQEFGGDIKIKEHTREIFFKQNKNGSVSTKFVKKDKSNFSQTVTIPEHIVHIPMRPFLRMTIAMKSKSWADLFEEVVSVRNMDSNKALSLLGERIVSDIRATIEEWSDPPNAMSTIRKKGFNKPLIDTGHMRDSVSYRID